jgi:ATP-dependent DNA helicase RecG
MPEHQNIEYKQSWNDEYLKWICGFANAQGGTIIIGKDDNGKPIGVAHSKELMEGIPNKIREHLGIIVDVNLLDENGKDNIEIITPPYSNPISLRGRYYYRSGSTKMELTGNALNDFLLKKSGKTWDDIVETRAQWSDIDESSITKYLNTATKSGRLPDVNGLNIREIVEKLRLMEHGCLKRAAIILFGKDPNKFYPNLEVKIGRFDKTDDDLKFQEVEEGNLIQLLKNVPEQLNRKFFTKSIDFEGLQRIERGEYPVAALREMLLNSLVHKDYKGSTIQIRVHNDRINIWNEGVLPEGLTFDSLKRQHPSRPRNPIIADVCFKGGYIDTWGRGTLKIITSCKEAELPEPEIKEQDGGIIVTLFKEHFTEEQLKKMNLNERQIKAVLYVRKNGKITNKVYQELNRISKPTATRDIKELVEKLVLKNSGTKGGSAIYVLF